MSFHKNANRGVIVCVRCYRHRRRHYHHCHQITNFNFVSAFCGLKPSIRFRKQIICIDTHLFSTFFLSSVLAFVGNESGFN